MTLSLDFTYMMDTAVPGALDAGAWRDAAHAFAEAHAAVGRRHATGALGFIDLPGERGLLADVQRYAEGVRGRFDDVVVLGIGGSALGPIMLRTALRPPHWNLLAPARRDGFPRLHVLDNVDPATITGALDMLDLARTLFVVTSKSGGTAETMAQYLVVRERLGQVVGDAARDHLVFVTDPEKGALRKLARSEGITALDVPANVGGRFSVLTAVGMLPAALIGIDVAAILEGAGDMRARCAGAAVAGNPAGLFATLQWLADTRQGRRIHVMMPYVDALRDFAAWFVQLWAESLGKLTPAGESVGPTPLGALGATDQHSQVQLFMEGPADKTLTFIGLASRAQPVALPRLHGDVPELAYLGGRSLGELIAVEQRATAGALARRGRPSMTFTLDAVSPRNVGALIMLFELATAYAGALYGVEAFDQPGVELGKQFAYALLGRADADPAARAEWDALPAADARWQLEG